MNLLLDTIEAVGPDREAVTKALADVKDHDLIIGPITFDGHGQNSVALITKYVVQDGKWVVWEDSDYASGKRKLTSGASEKKQGPARAGRCQAHHPTALDRCA